MAIFGLRKRYPAFRALNPQSRELDGIDSKVQPVLIVEDLRDLPAGAAAATRAIGGSADSRTTIPGSAVGPVSLSGRKFLIWFHLAITPDPLTGASTSRIKPPAGETWTILGIHLEHVLNIGEARNIEIDLNPLNALTATFGAGAIQLWFRAITWIAGTNHLWLAPSVGLQTYALDPNLALRSSNTPTNATITGGGEFLGVMQFPFIVHGGGGELLISIGSGVNNLTAVKWTMPIIIEYT